MRGPTYNCGANDKIQSIIYNLNESYVMDNKIYITKYICDDKLREYKHLNVSTWTGQDVPSHEALCKQVAGTNTLIRFSSDVVDATLLDAAGK